MNRKMKRIFVSLLAFLLVFSNLGLTTSFVQAEEKSKQEEIKKLLSKEMKSLDKKDVENSFKDSDNVRVIVELDGTTPLEYATEKGVLFKELSETKKASLTEQVQEEQKDIKSSLKSKKVDIEYSESFDTAFNGFSGEVEYGDVEKIESTKGVKRVFLANEYNRPEVTPDMDTSHDYIQSRSTWADAEYKGEGMVVSVIDSGVDPSHRDFVLSDETEEELTSEKVGTIVKEEELPGKFFTEKVPYGYNYYDKNDIITDEGPDASMHGMHVSGTVVANGDESNGGLKGVAPEAQVLGMKVFSNDPDYPSTWSDVYLAAIDDSIKLGADVLNMSLGSTASFYEPESAEDLAITRAVENGIVCAVSAGNSGHIASGWGDPYYNDPDIGVVGAPGLNTDTIQVAASGNTSYWYQHSITDGSDLNLVGYGIDSWADVPEFEVVSLSALNEKEETSGESCVVCGNPEDFTDVDVKGKVVLVKRGALSFMAKTNNAAAAGAIGIIVYDHGTSTFYKNQGGWNIPFMKVSKEEGETLAKRLEDGSSLTLNASELDKSNDPEMGRMTDFTSWGTTPSLELKPEITAPGGKIYSTLQDDQYGLMSGTSMASPHVAGGAALVQQYLQNDERFNETSSGDRARLAKQLLMSTAEVIEDLDGKPFSPRRQGAGMMQTLSAVYSPAYLVDKQTDESKVELFDFKETSFTMTFEAVNISNEEVTYNVHTDVLADRFKAENFGEDNEVLYNLALADHLEGAKITSPDEITVPAGGSKEFTVTVDFSEAKVKGEDQDGNEVTKSVEEDMFIEGFVYLTDKENGAPQLSIPYNGFYGEWDRPEILDGFKDYGEDKLYAMDDFNDMLTGDGNFVAPVDGEKYYPVSPNGDGLNDDIYPFPAFLRNAKEVQYNVYDKNNKLLRRVLTEENVRKTYYDQGSGSYYSFNPERAWDGTVKSETVEDGIYYYEIKSTIDYKDAKWQSKKIPVYVDTKSPTIEITSFEEEENKISWKASDEGVGIEKYLIFVNGEQLDATISSDQTSYTFDSIENAVVEVVAVDYANNFAMDSTPVADSDSPVIYLGDTDPAPYGSYNILELPVTGYVQEETGLSEVKVNGKSVDFKLNEETGNYDFSATATFDEEGMKDIIVSATDTSGNEISISRRVFIDTTAPIIEQSNEKFVDEKTTEYDLSFDVSDNYSYFSVYVDDNHLKQTEIETPAQVLEPGKESFTEKVTLEPGYNTFTVKVTDLGGTTVTEEISIYRPTGNEEKPMIQLGEEPKQDSAYNTKEVPVKGSIHAKFELEEVTVNDSPIQLSLNEETGYYEFSTTVGFKEDGKQVVKVTAKDTLGNKSSLEQDVFIDSVGPELELNAPESVDYNVTETELEITAKDNFSYFSIYEGEKEVKTTKMDSPADVLEAGEEKLTHKVSLEPGKNTFTVKVTDLGGTTVSKEITIDRLNIEKEINRLQGVDRYETSVEISKAGWNKSDTVILARGDNYADALAGVPLSHKLDAPLLLTESNTLTDVTLDEISRLKASKVIILGGKAAISQDVADVLKAEKIGVERIWGDDRYETAQKIAKEVAPNGTETAVVVNGQNFPDALSVASYAAKHGYPILLTGADELADPTETALEELNVKSTYVIGGEKVVTPGVMDQLPKAKRLAGEDRYKTSVAVSNYFDKGADHQYIATGEKFADALSGAALAAKEGTGVLLVGSSVHEE
ncbi:cell wall-binding repeat-containing protein [Bacillus carboniphilus]|uniref:Cell wall-binding repeat-containing protein n=1 Tax=Bacillus carboniphilus TaxID=86663 RepID=A0ABY9JV88_9BACI|nr:cell wall-binding repeat-containing protein [Bacillus carboniphilus]WLR41596.1 cell wall-binding repeat-containing protein [Bacillus carboniphilus]